MYELDAIDTIDGQECTRAEAEALSVAPQREYERLTKIMPAVDTENLQ